MALVRKKSVPGVAHYQVEGFISIAYVLSADKKKREERGFGYMIDTPNRTFPLSGSNSLALALKSSEKVPGDEQWQGKSGRSKIARDFLLKSFAWESNPNQAIRFPDSHPPKRISDPPKITI